VTLRATSELKNPPSSPNRDVHHFINGIHAREVWVQIMTTWLKLAKRHLSSKLVAFVGCFCPSIESMLLKEIYGNSI